jgi:hypothetical protein
VRFADEGTSSKEATMGLFGRKKNQSTLIEDKPECLHIGLTARWDNIDDMGNEDKATSFVCATCSAEFTPEEARGIRAKQADQLRKDLA